MNAIDDEKVLNHFYDSREVFIVDFDSELVEVNVEKGTATFSLKRVKK